MKSGKKQKKKKRKSLILLLLLTIIMFGTSTYAWFTANEVVTINDINVNVAASDGIQISTDGLNWKSVITNADITKGYPASGSEVDNSGSKNQLPSTVTAVSTNGAIDTTGDTKGQVPMYIATITNDTNSNYVLTAARDAETGKDYIAFDIFLRVNKIQTVYLTPDSQVTTSDTVDRGLKNAARIGFAKKGEAVVESTVDALRTLNNPSGTAIIWEPNSEAHTTAVVNSVAPNYGVTLGTPKTTYFGVNQAFDTPVNLKTIVKDGHDTYTTQMSTVVATTSDVTTKTQFLSLNPGITKYRVYMWVEGQDIDCENNATGSNITYKLQLTTKGNE